MRIQKDSDIFVFYCYTGPAYAGVKKRTTDEITIGIDGKDGSRLTDKRKTAEFHCFLQHLKLRIGIKMIHCAESRRVLTALSNQKMNVILKRSLRRVTSKRRWRFHTARHTFAVTVTLANDVPMETVSKLLSHRNLKTRPHYGKILDLKVSQNRGMLRASLRRISNRKTREPSKSQTMQTFRKLTTIVNFLFMNCQRIDALIVSIGINIRPLSNEINPKPS